MTLPRWISKLAWLRPDAPFQAVRVGDVVLLAVPGEPTTAVGKQLKALVTDPTTLPLIVAPANDYLAYITTTEEYADDGYESDSNLFGPEAVTRVTEALSAAVRNLESNP